MADIDNLLLSGQKLPPNIRRALSTAELSTTTSEVSQLTATFSDPNWNFLKGTAFGFNTTVEVSGYKFYIAALSTGDNSGTENITVECRPQSVRNLKNRRGARVMSNISPSEFVIAECKAVGVSYIVEGSARRAQISRDVDEAGAQETQNEPKSSWTTFKRLAKEVGFIVFEAANTIHFGRPSWLVSSAPVGGVVANYKTGARNTRMVNVPSCRSSADDPDRTVGFMMSGIHRATFRAGKRVTIAGIPRFEGNFLLSSVEWDLMNESTDITCSATIPQDPIPQPPQETPAV